MHQQQTSSIYVRWMRGTLRCDDSLSLFFLPLHIIPHGESATTHKGQVFTTLYIRGWETAPGRAGPDRTGQRWWRMGIIRTVQASGARGLGCSTDSLRGWLAATGLFWWGAYAHNKFPVLARLGPKCGQRGSTSFVWDWAARGAATALFFIVSP